MSFSKGFCERKSNENWGKACFGKFFLLFFSSSGIFLFYFQFPYHFSQIIKNRRKINTEIAKAGGITDGFKDKEDSVTNDYDDDDDDEGVSDCNDNDFICTDRRQCVLTEKVCNGVKDCNDGSDEENCEDVDEKKGDYICLLCSILSAYNFIFYKTLTSFLCLLFSTC